MNPCFADLFSSFSLPFFPSTPHPPKKKKKKKKIKYTSMVETAFNAFTIFLNPDAPRQPGFRGADAVAVQTLEQGAWAWLKAFQREDREPQRSRYVLIACGKPAGSGRKREHGRNLQHLHSFTAFVVVIRTGKCQVFSAFLFLSCYFLEYLRA